MISAKYSVEDLIIARLIMEYPDDLPDNAIERDFKALCPVFEIAMAKVLRKFAIPPFSDDDLKSFMYLQAHQILRRQRYDFEKNPYAFFYVSFNNLMLDIIRRLSTEKRKSMEKDLFDTGLVVSHHFREEHYLLEMEVA